MEQSPPTKQKQPGGFRRNVLLTGSGTFVTIILLFIETMIVVRLLSTETYGVYVLLIALVNFLITLVDMGFKTAGTKFVASSEQPQQVQIVHSLLLFRLAVVIGISLVLLLGHMLLLRDTTPDSFWYYLKYVPLMLLFASFDELLLGLLQGFHAYKLIAGAQIMRSVLRIGLTILFISVFQLGMLALIYSWIISFALSALYQLFALPISRRLAYDGTTIKDVLHFGFPLYSTRFLWFLFRRINVLLLGALAGPASVAFYEVAARVPDALQRLSESFTAVYFPTISSLLAKNQREQVSHTLNESVRLLSFVVGVGVLISVLFSKEIVILLFSEKYVESALAFALLMLAFQMAFILNIMGYTLTAAGYPQRSLGKNFLRTAITVVGDLILIPLFSFVGPAAASLLANHMTNPLGIWLLRKSDINILAKPYIKQSLLLMLCCVLFWWLQPIAILYKIAMIVCFVAGNILLSTVTVHDLRLLLPNRFSRLAKAQPTESLSSSSS